MAVVRTEKLKYTKASVEVYTFETGLSVWKDIEWYYRDESFRDKVICRIDTIPLLHDIFSREILEKYRTAIFFLASMQSHDPEQISGIIRQLADIDKLFASKITEYYYTCDMDVSFGEYIIQSIADAIRMQENRFRDFFRGKTESVICLSNGYLYICVPDGWDTIAMPEKVNCEVISNAKNWSGQITFPS